MTANDNTRTADDALPELPAIDDTAAANEPMREKLADAGTPGYQVEFDPDEAERAGAFVEDALSEQDAAEGTDDLAELGGDEAPAFSTRSR